ncbi:hypothetical protein ABEB36_005505 [Hypothenemus hampei]|uniref:Uncharacterized protein n=1 Tax=Hypothenemus hampei TaxID=57062 RepID=A0ABD1EZK2_HYPHA
MIVTLNVIILLYIYFEQFIFVNSIGTDRILSRKRRYLVFPEGSSFQAVFDLTYPALAIQGNVFVFGHTAAMAWELPSKPIFLDKMKTTKDKNKKEDKQEIIDDFAMKLPYDPQWLNSTDYELIGEDQNYISWNDQHTFYDQNPSDFWMQFDSGNFQKKIKRSVAHHVRRQSRRELYTKIEKFLTALGNDGRQCVLKAICQVTKLQFRTGKLWEELLKSLFKSTFHPNFEIDHYDRAANLNHDCENMYTNCSRDNLRKLLNNKSKK